MKKIKVMHVILDMGPGGAERVVLSYMKKMDRKVFEPILCVLYRAWDTEMNEAIALGIPCFHLNKKQGWDTRMLLKLIDVIRKEQIDILHLHNFSAIIYGTLAALLSTRPKIIRTEHNVIVTGKSIKRRALRFLKNLLGVFHRKIIAVSDEVKQSQTQSDILFKKKYITIYNGIETGPHEQVFDHSRYLDEFGFSKEDIIFGKIASMYPQKAHEILFEAIKKVTAEISGARFLIVGDGPRSDELKQMVHKMGLDRYVIFTGIRSDVKGLLAFIDVFVLSSNWEGFPITILEAMGSGTPVVVTDVGGNREAVVNKETGYLVEHGNPEKLAIALIKIGKDEALRRRMGQNANMRLHRFFTAEIMVEKTEDIYRKLTAEQS